METTANLTHVYYATGKRASDGYPAIVECQKTVPGWTTRAIEGEKAGLGNEYVSNETVDELCDWLHYDFLGKYHFTDSLENAQTVFLELNGSRLLPAAARA